MSATTPQTFTLTPQQTGALRDRLSAYCGVFLDDTRSTALAAATQARARARGLAPEAYIAALGGERGELQRLAELLLNH